ncbi:MAG TPA: hypothetical protein VMZ73_01045 [Acidimicrobiales bacterium]|nr:hypothetical protein [Acidimicrobiales bacterium]
MSFWTARAVRSSVVALLLIATGGCADPNFTSNGEDARRLDVLKTDAMYRYLTGRTGCEEALARYVPSKGLPLDFAGIEANHVTCDLPNDETAELLVAAESAGWTPSVFLSSFQFRKKFGSIWGSMTLTTGADDFTVTLAAPDHTREGVPPGLSQTAEGRACLDAVRAHAPPTHACSLAR